VRDRVLDLVDGAARLATDFPQLRASGDAFSAWASRAALETSGTTAREGFDLLEPRERRRIERAIARELPAIWRSFCDETGDEELAAYILVLGAVIPSVEELAPPDSARLELLEAVDDLRGDPCVALASVLDYGDLWGVRESIQVDAALAALPEELDDEEYDRRWEETIEVMATRLTTRWHRKRLPVLVRRLRARLPLAGYAEVSAALESACEAFERDRAVRARLAAELLADSLPAPWARSLPLAA
jgi:hypothetical protein